ncbi:ABC transporter substrate-binding protein [Labrys miyagiensis]|uniref:ABC transporter substrate-binding protein n=1 Tax=Labrys miyagiensis TaxID=346912 RepID=A0ABQ6CQX3_9HYPH|nr:ABC transporter substrate-binding protein [Labrys miyagiensis]GLS21997.1 ABC transporter substrate-binding protein [Labrys miyagiensis]
MHIIQNRRRFLTGFAAASAAGLLGPATSARAEPRPETTRVRLPIFFKTSDCQAPEFIAEELLRAEGFTDVRFVAAGTGPDSSDWIAHGEIDFDWNFPPALISQVYGGVPIKILAGLHAGCLELFANESIRSIMDLKGKRVGIDISGGNTHKLLIIHIAYVGLDPQKDIEWVTGADAVEMFAARKIDAFLATPPQPQVMRERKLGHVILKTSVDRPWSQYYCCMLSGSKEYVGRYPVATKRVMRALLKAIDLCISDPERVARLAVENGTVGRYDFALQAMTDARYDKWRDYDPADSIRFYALRMKETGMTTASPQAIIADGTDWSFLNELRRELKT